MENRFFKMFGVESLFENLKGYIDARIQLIKLEIQEKTAHIITIIAIAALLFFAFFMTIIFLSIALGGFLNEVLNSMFLGHLIVGAIYLVASIALAINIKSGFLNKKIHQAVAAIFNPKK
ncbi:phage holin family protein [Cytophagaceae bacterium ABcell3]|nr:phage holin family protein [Cytophagaceae bacterium ABcell3]